jgi:hypothetical protein
VKGTTKEWLANGASKNEDLKGVIELPLVVVPSGKRITLVPEARKELIF